MHDTNKLGLENFARNFFDLQKTVPDSRYIEPEQREEQKPAKYIQQYLEALQLWNENKGDLK